MKNTSRKLLIFCILSLMHFTASGQGRAHLEPVFGVEWGGALTLAEYYHWNYIAGEGNRVDEKGNIYSFKSTGVLMAKAGVRFYDHYTATLNSGIIGIRQQRSAVPITARFTYSFHPYDTNGWICYLEGGAVYPNRYYANFIAESGAGYRLNLSHRFSLDFTVSLRVCGDERQITDPETGNEVDVWNIRKNNSLFHAACYKIALNF